jgi:hypothetical protein
LGKISAETKPAIFTAKSGTDSRRDDIIYFLAMSTAFCLQTVHLQRPGGAGSGPAREKQEKTHGVFVAKPSCGWETPLSHPCK